MEHVSILKEVLLVNVILDLLRKQMLKERLNVSRMIVLDTIHMITTIHPMVMIALVIPLKLLKMQLSMVLELPFVRDQAALFVSRDQ